MTQAYSKNAYQREMAVYEMTAHFHPEYEQPLTELLLDEDVSVRRAVIKNIAKTKLKRFNLILDMVRKDTTADELPLIDAAMKELEATGK